MDLSHEKFFKNYEPFKLFISTSSLVFSIMFNTKNTKYAENLIYYLPQLYAYIYNLNNIYNNFKGVKYLV